MNERAPLTIEKIPLRLSLNWLTREECLAHAGRSFFSALGKHPLQHPLMHQIGTNPDCRALAVCAEGVPLASCFFHYRINEGGKKSVVVHTFMVAPYCRGRGLGSLLALEILEQLTKADCETLSVELEFPTPPLLSNQRTPLFAELIANKALTARGAELEDLKNRIAEEKKGLTRQILSSFIAQPNYRVRQGREECFVGTVSGTNEFFQEMGNVAWPEFVVTQAIHLDFHKDVVSRADLFDLLVMDGTALATKPDLLAQIVQEKPGLPIVVVGGEHIPESLPLLLRTELAGLRNALEPFLRVFDPKVRKVSGKAEKTNLLGIPERGSLVYFKNRHRGKRLFIAASGPSLAEVDVELLARETVMTINDAIHMFPKTTYATIMDSRKLHELHLEVLNAEAVFTLVGNSFGTEIELLGTDGFSTDLEEGIFSGYTTAYFCLQLAVYMGFREVYYLGLDLGNTSSRSHFFGNRTLQDRDRPDVYAKMRQSFERISGRTKEFGISVYNCSPVSELKCFPFKRLEDVLAE